MLKTFYIQIDEVNRVTDVIEYPYGDYIEVELNTPLPYGILGGSYKLMDNQVIYIPDWDTDNLNNKLDTSSKELMEAQAELYEMLLETKTATEQLCNDTEGGCPSLLALSEETMSCMVIIYAKLIKINSRNLIDVPLAIRADVGTKCISLGIMTEEEVNNALGI